ncbi:MAG: hypothetical protein AAGA93_24415 [Actinomycetota bacterium]
MSLLDKLLFWRNDETPPFDVDACFTLPGAEVGAAGTTAGDACDDPSADEDEDSGASW